MDVIIPLKVLGDTSTINFIPAGDGPGRNILEVGLKRDDVLCSRFTQIATVAYNVRTGKLELLGYKEADEHGELKPTVVHDHLVAAILHNPHLVAAIYPYGREIEWEKQRYRYNSITVDARG